jgi:serine protease Do
MSIYRLRSTLWGLALLLLMAAVPGLAASLPDFTHLVKESSPAVVNISSVQNGDNRKAKDGSPFEGYRPDQLPEIFKHFFGDNGLGNKGFGAPKRSHPKSLGSGFIISSDGYILTNNHVIKDADEIVVRLSDRRELMAELVGADARSDLALLKIEAGDLPVVRLGNSDRLQPGEWVLAIGSPFGFDYTVTAGIVSAMGRSLANENYVPFIQTDVAINPGNSGGPLFNLDGEVVGINSQIYTRSGGFMGLSFAIPIVVAMEVVEQLKETGYVARGWLGVIIQEVNKDLAESFGLDKPAGALIAKVLPNSPAESAELREGDIILKFNDKPVRLSSELPQLVGRVKPGTEVNLDIVREGRRKRFELNVGELPSDETLHRAAGGQREPEMGRLGLVIAPLEPERKAKWSLNGGVVVRKVGKGPAADAGLVVGDVITMLNGHRVDTMSDFSVAVDELPTGRAVPIRVVRRGNPLFLPLKLSLQ